MAMAIQWHHNLDSTIVPTHNSYQSTEEQATPSIQYEDLSVFSYSCVPKSVSNLCSRLTITWRVSQPGHS